MCGPSLRSLAEKALRIALVHVLDEAVRTGQIDQFSSASANISSAMSVTDAMKMVLHIHIPPDRSQLERGVNRKIRREVLSMVQTAIQLDGDHRCIARNIDASNASEPATIAPDAIASIRIYEGDVITGHEHVEAAIWRRLVEAAQAEASQQDGKQAA
jgi:hypothetical protein